MSYLCITRHYLLYWDTHCEMYKHILYSAGVIAEEATELTLAWFQTEYARIDIVREN